MNRELAWRSENGDEMHRDFVSSLHVKVEYGVCVFAWAFDDDDCIIIVGVGFAATFFIWTEIWPWWFSLVGGLVG
jgi:hypothetical protein